MRPEEAVHGYVNNQRSSDGTYTSGPLGTSETAVLPMRNIEGRRRLVDGWAVGRSSVVRALARDLG